MAKLFSVATYMTKGGSTSETVKVYSHWCTAETKEQAEAWALSEVLLEHPPQNGWGYHTVVSIEIPEHIRRMK